MFHLVNVYMPWQQRDLSSDIEFLNLLGEFHTILESLEDDKTVRRIRLLILHMKIILFSVILDCLQTVLHT